MLDDDRKAICTALKSGQFKKCRDYLRKGDTHDIFGVFCELFPDPAWVWERFDDSVGQPLSDLYIYRKKGTDVTHVAGLPDHIKKRLELEDEDVSLLTALNDGLGDWHERPQSFVEIANWIELKF